MATTTTSTSIQPKVLILTGGNSGLGYEALKQLLLHQTPYHIILPVRNPKNAENQFSKLKVPKQHKLETTHLDLAQFESVWKFVTWFLEQGVRLHVLILNAGALFSDLGKTTDGFERTFQVNHLSNFLLAQLLLPHLLSSGPGSRIVFVNSALHIKGIGQGEGPNLEVENLDGSKKYDGLLFYRNSKLAQMLCAYQLDKSLEKEITKTQSLEESGHVISEKRKVTVITLNPGFVPETGLNRESNFFLRIVLRFIFPLLPFTKSPAQGGAVIVHAATSPALENISPAVWINENCQIVNSAEESYDAAKQKFWWNLSCTYLGLADKKIQ
ncbi:hypothetical protein G9A89_002312 [Geosiphon pyriformis]|nr:hypothetical protein G9A89_002312 [Geosiphon pyriformis]